MAMLHVCQACGLDLARTRPRRDPHYGLPLVTCPRCRWACVRRRHPVDRAWRAARRLIRSLRALWAQLLVCLILAPATIGLAAQFGALADMKTLAWILENERFLAVLTLLVIPLLTGTWLGGAFSHWRFGSQWLAWLAVLFLLGWVYIPLAEWLDRWYIDGSMPPLPWHYPYWSQRLLTLLMMSAISLLGWPLGGIARRIANENRRLRWRKRRRRMTRQRRER